MTNHLRVLLASEHDLGSAIPSCDHVLCQLCAATLDVASQAQVAHLLSPRPSFAARHACVVERKKRKKGAFLTSGMTEEESNLRHIRKTNDL